MVRFFQQRLAAASWQIESLLLVSFGGMLALLAGLDVAIIPLEILSFVLLIYGGLLVPIPRQPLAVLYEPRNIATRLLKWISAPQVEAAMLFWFGWSFLIQPEQISAFRLTGSIIVSDLLGLTFLIFGWLMVVRLPSPLEYTLLTSTRLAYTLVVVLDVWINDIPIVVIGTYFGSVLHGVVSILLHWTLRELAQDVLRLEHKVQELKDKQKG